MTNTMFPPIPHLHAQAALFLPPVETRAMTREDVLWERPIFRAPPLDRVAPGFDASLFADDLLRIGLVRKPADV